MVLVVLFGSLPLEWVCFVSFFFLFFPFGQFNESLLTPQKNKGQREWLKLLEFDFYLWVKYYNQF